LQRRKFGNGFARADVTDVTDVTDVRKKEEERRKKEDRRGDGCQLNVKGSTDLLFNDDCPDPLI
jgi:hypothetical protein